MNSTFHLPVFCFVQDECIQLPEGIVLYPWYTFVIVLASFPGHVGGGLGMRLAFCCFHHDGELNFVFCFFSSDDERDTNFESRKPTSVRDVRCEEGCNRIAVEAVKRGCTDNVTVMIVDIMHPL